jgi:predicted Zn-dependent peptidase
MFSWRSTGLVAALGLLLGVVPLLPPPLPVPAALGVAPAAAEELNLAGVRVNVVERKLDNGLTLVMVENHQSPTVGLMTQFHAGSVDEYDGISGSAHILEHTLFKGTPELGTTDWAKEKVLLDQLETTAQQLRQEKSRERGGDPARVARLQAAVDSLQGLARGYVIPNMMEGILTEAGGQNVNAGTNWDGTGYQVALPSNRIELWMKLESDRLKNPVLREFYTEKNNILEERRMGVENEPSGPLGKLAEALYGAAFTAHRYGVPIIGWVSDLQGVTRTEVEAFFRRNYAPNNATISIVGDIDPVQTYEMVKAYFGTIPRQPDPFRPRTVEPPQEGERRVSVEFPAEPRVMIGWHMMSGLDPDYPALLVMDDILTGGRSSRLYREVVEKQKVAASISGYTGVPGERYPALYILEATPLAPHTTAEVEAAIYSQLEELAKTPPTPAEMEAAQTRYKKSFVEGQVDNMGLASILAFNQGILGDWRIGFRRAEAVAKLTPADIQKVAQTYLKASNRTVATLVKPAEAAATTGEGR